MKRTMIYLDEAQHLALQLEAQRLGRPMAELVREAVSDYLNRLPPKPRNLDMIGLISDLPPDNVSERVDEVLAEAFRDYRG